jgi:hypothetical protein
VEELPVGGVLPEAVTGAEEDGWWRSTAMAHRGR